MIGRNPGPHPTASCSPSSQLCSHEKARGPLPSTVPLEAAAPGPERRPFVIGLAVTCPPHCPGPSATFREKETKGSKSGGGGLPLPLPSPHTRLPSPERRCSYQKRLLKDDLFYFSLTLSSLGRRKKKMTKPTIKDQKKENQKTPT